MVLDIEESTPFIAIGVVFGIIFMVIFSWQFGLSPLTKIVLLLGGFLVFLVGAYERILPSRRVFYTLSGLSFVVAIVYGFSVFHPDTGTQLLILLLSSAIFLVLGYELKQDEFEYSEHRAHQLVIGLLVFSVLLTGYDVISGDATVELDPEEEVLIQSQEDVRIATTTVTNPSMLPRDRPDLAYRTCIGLGDRTEYAPTNMDQEYDQRPLGPLSSETYDVTFQVPRDRNGSVAYQGTYTVEEGSVDRVMEVESERPIPTCEQDLEEGTIVIEDTRDIAD